jgi:pimeloyl-ACP methyl ester carboxylesterase
MTAEPLPRRFTTADGLTLVADEWVPPGDAGDAPVVLMAHGGGQTRHAWGGTAAALARTGWRAISIDQRGHGDSDWSPEGRYDVGAFGQDLRDVARGFDRPPAVVGASLGGVAAILAAGEADGPPVFPAVVLVDITPRVERTGVERIIRFMSAHKDEGFATLEEAADAIAAYIPDRPRPKDLSGLAKNLRKRPDGRWRWHWDPRFITDIDARSADRNPDRLENAVRRIAQPILLVRGKSSDLVTEEGAKALLAVAPNARYVDVTGAGHMVAGDRNDIFTRAVTDFLGEAR